MVLWDQNVLHNILSALPPNLIVQGSEQEQKQGQEGPLKEQEWRPKGEILDENKLLLRLNQI